MLFAACNKCAFDILWSHRSSPYLQLKCGAKTKWPLKQEYPRVSTDTHDIFHTLSIEAVYKWQGTGTRRASPPGYRFPIPAGAVRFTLTALHFSCPLEVRRLTKSGARTFGNSDGIMIHYSSLHVRVVNWESWWCTNLWQLCWKTQIKSWLTILLHMWE